MLIILYIIKVTDLNINLLLHIKNISLYLIFEQFKRKKIAIILCNELQFINIIINDNKTDYQFM